MPLSEFTKLQLQQCVETYRVQLSLLVQICTVFVIADATTVGYAFQQRLASVIWVGMVFPVTMLIVMRVVVSMTIPALAVAVSIEMKYKEEDLSGLMSSFVSVAISPEFLEKLRAAAAHSSETARISSLSRLTKPYLFSGSRMVKRILYLIIFGHVVAPPLLWWFAGWGLFNK
jgi:hypothetical protein